MYKKLTRLPYIVCYLCALVLGMKHLREPDIWWQLLSGRWMLENGAVTRTDMFSYTMEGAKWINVKWLYEVLIAAMEKPLGPHAVMLLQALVNVAIVYLLLRSLLLLAKQVGRQVSTLYSTIAVILFLAVSEFRMAGRPEMISHMLSAVYIFVLWNSKGFQWKRIWVLIPLQCLWANMHEAYPVGMAITGIYIAGGVIAWLAMGRPKEYLQSITRLVAVFAGMALAILLNPNTIQLWLQPFEIFRQLKANQYTTELLSYKDALYWTFQAKVHLAMFVLTCLYWVVRAWLHKKGMKQLTLTPVLAGYLLSLVVIEYLSLTANRNIPFAQITFFPTIPLAITLMVELLRINKQAWYINFGRRTMIISTLAAILFYIATVSNRYYKFTESPNRYGLHISILHNPVGAAEFINRHNLQGPAFSDYFVSSYLLWALYPQFKSYIDLRDLDIFPAEFFDEYLEMVQRPSAFHLKDSVYKFNYVVLSTSQLLSVQQMLYWGKGFNVVYIDPVSLILVRDTKGNEPVSHSKDATRLFTWPQEPVDPGWAEAITKLLNPAASYEEEEETYAPIHAAKFYNAVRNPPISIKLLGPAIQSDLADNPEALALLGQSYIIYADYMQTNADRKSKLDSAGIFYLNALELDEKSSNARLGLATLAIMRNDFNKAKEHLKYCIEADPGNDFVFYLEGLCSRALWKSNGDGKYLDEMIASMEHSARLNPANTRAYLYIAEGYAGKGDIRKAKENMSVIDDANVPLAPNEKETLLALKKQIGG